MARPGVDVGVAECAGDRHAVAPVEDVVAVWSFDDGDRGQRAPCVVCARDALPAGRHAIGGGPEAGVEIGRGVDGSDDRIERN